MPSELLRQVRLIDPTSNTDHEVDVLIGDGTIRAIGQHLEASRIPKDVTTYDQPGLVLGPGLVDLYSHSGEPGHETRETLASLGAAAAAGGFTRVTLLPSTTPAIDTPGMVNWVRSHTQDSPVRVGCWGAMTQQVDGQHMTELAELAATDIAGFADGQPITNRALLSRLLEYAHPLQKPVALWCCDPTLRGDGVAREGLDALRFGLPGAPAIAETVPLTAVLEYVATLGTPVHIMRVSTARSVELIAQAKASGLPITASTTWLHLLLSTPLLQTYDPALRVEPPLGTPADQAALVQAVADGIIDAIAVDHSPFTYEEKTVAFAEAPPGAIGLELALPLLWQAFVASGQWSPLTLWRSLSTNPARCLNQPPPMIGLEHPAELVLFNPQHVWKVTPQTLRSRSYNTPWLGEEIVGQIVRVWATPHPHTAQF